MKFVREIMDSFKIEVSPFFKNSLVTLNRWGNHWAKKDIKEEYYKIFYTELLKYKELKKLSKSCYQIKLISVDYMLHLFDKGDMMNVLSIIDKVFLDALKNNDFIAVDNILNYHFATFKAKKIKTCKKDSKVVITVNYILRR